MMFKGKKGICAALSLSLILSAAFFPEAAYASEKVTAYVVSSILYDMDIGDYSDSRAEKLSYYDSGLLRMVNSAGESVDNVGENIYSYSIREEYSYTKKNFPKKYTYSYSEALLEGEEDPIEAKWSVAFTVNDQGMVRKYRQEETGEAVKFKYENGLMVKKTNGVISTSFDYTDGVITHAKTKNTEDGSVNEINFELDQYGNVKKETGIFKHIVDGEYDTEEKVNNYKLVYRNKRLVKLKSERDLYLFKYKKIKIPAENYDMVMRQQRLILNQYSMLDDYFMFYL